MPSGNNNLLKFKLSAWTDRAESLQYKIPFDTPHDFRNVLELEYKLGNLQLIEISNDNEFLGVLFFRIEKYQTKEFVIVAIQSKISGLDFSIEVNNFCVKLARQINCVSIRYNTLRPALVEKGLDNGYHISEITMRKKL